MLHICHSFAQFNDIVSNHKKSVCFKVGPLWCRSASAMMLGNKDLQWVTSFKYLGINFLSGLALKIDTCHIKRTFYKACNGILSQCSTADVFVKLSLVKAYCLPVLTYCIGALNLPVVQFRDLVYAGMTVFVNYMDTNVLNLLKRFNIFVVNYRLT